MKSVFQRIYDLASAKAKTVIVIIFNKYIYYLCVCVKKPIKYIDVPSTELRHYRYMCAETKV